MSEPIRDIKIDKDTDLNTIFEMMHKSGGFMAVSLAMRLISEIERVVRECGP